MKGMLLFTEVANSLKKIRSQFTSRTLNLRGTSLDLSDIEEMLKHETSDFEVGFLLVQYFDRLHLLHANSCRTVKLVSAFVPSVCISLL
jgi:hypothetical protein